MHGIELALWTIYLSKFVSEAQPFLLNEHLKANDSAVVRIKHDHSQPSQLKRQFKAGKAGVKGGNKGDSPEQFCPSHRCNAPTQMSYCSQLCLQSAQPQQGFAAVRETIPVLNHIETVTLQAFFKAMELTLMCSSQWVDSILESQCESSMVGKQMSFNLRKLEREGWEKISRLFTELFQQ